MTNSLFVPKFVATRLAARSFRALISPRRQGLVAALITLSVLLVFWLYATQWYKERLLLEQRAEAVSEISARANTLSSAVNRRMARLQGLYAFVQTEGLEPDFGQEFERFAAGLFAGSRGIRSLAVAPGGEIRYIYPLDGNETVLGYQPLLDPRPEVAADARRAITSGQVILSGPVELLQGGLGLIARQAVYQEGQYWGLVNVAVDMNSLLTEAGLVGGTGQLEYALRDGQEVVFFGSPSTFTRQPIVTQIFLPEGSWELAATPHQGWPALIWQPLFITRIGGLITIILITVLVYLSVQRQSWLAAAVERQTQEISAANVQLEQRVEERTLELTMLLNISQSIVSTLELEVLLERVLFKLMPVVDYTGGFILTLENGTFTVRAYKGPFSQESILGSHYTFDNIIGRQLIQERKPVLITDVSAHSPLASAFRQSTEFHPDQLAQMRSWMGIPLVTKKKVIGMLALHHQEPDIYTQRDAALVLAFANHAAVAIENARLHDQAQRLAVLQERQRLSRELHDSISQALYGIALGTRTARRLLDQSTLEGKSKAALAEPLDYILSLTEGGLAEMRALIFELRPDSLESEGLVAILSQQAAALQARHRVEVTARLGEEPDAALSTKEVLYRVGQEAMQNIVKHANATKMTISLLKEDGHLVLQISDNGRGFDANGSFAGHLGLRSMRERVEGAGGALTVNSTPGQGTHIMVSVPAADGPAG